MVVPPGAREAPSPAPTPTPEPTPKPKVVKLAKSLRAHPMGGIRVRRRPAAADAEATAGDSRTAVLHYLHGGSSAPAEAEAEAAEAARERARVVAEARLRSAADRSIARQITVSRQQSVMVARLKGGVNRGGWGDGEGEAGVVVVGERGRRRSEYGILVGERT